MKFADESASDHVRYASAKALHRLMLAKSFILNKEGGNQNKIKTIKQTNNNDFNENRNCNGRM